jgi:hypothetical protein
LEHPAILSASGLVRPEIDKSTDVFVVTVMSEDPLTDNPEPLVLQRDPTSSIVKRRFLTAVGWLAAAVVSLLVAAIPYDAEESVCGVWGCYPPLQALAAMHLLWCAVLGSIVWSIREWRPRLLLPVGLVLIIVAAPATAVVIGNDLHHWTHGLPERYHKFWPRRIAYTLSTLTDLPLVQSLLAGMVCIQLGRRRTHSGSSKEGCSLP